jgi:TolB-like protein/Flp pilus assembly protein TadD
MPEPSRATGAVFLSYASQDAEAAARVCNTLRAAGVEVWFDQSELRGGDSWDSKIKKQIQDCALFLPVISAHSNARAEGYFRREWNLATRRLLDMAHDATFLVPVVIDATREDRARVPEEFLRVQWTRLPDGETPSAFAHRLRQLLAVDGVAEHAQTAAEKKNIEASGPGRVVAQPGGVLRSWRLGLALVASLLVLGGGIFWYQRERSDASPAEHMPASVPGVTAATQPEQSIAVLPFENLSADPDNAFFAVGIQDEILTSLAKISGLKVISRTSTLKYGAKPENLGAIATELGVANILEGSVQRIKNRVRVNVQLIDARTDGHRWADTFDRDLADVFAVQSEIARTIADALKANLTDTERAALTKAPTDNAQAYEHYLRGRALIFGAPTYQRKPTEDSIKELEAAVALDPAFVKAWADLVFQQVWLYFSGLEPTHEQLARARTARDRLVALAPDAAETDSARALYLYYGEQKFAEALAFVRRAQSKAPVDARGWYISAILARRLGRWAEAEADFRRGRELSPNDYVIISELALTYFYQRRYAESLPLTQMSLSLQPDDSAMLSIKLPTLWNLEGLDGGRRMMQALSSQTAGAVALRARQAEFERNDARALALYRQAVAMHEDDDFWPSDFGGYVPASVDTRLRLAALEKRVDPAAAEKRYRALLAEADASLRSIDSRYAKAAWHAVRGLTLAGLGRKREAVDAGRRAIDLVPEDFDALESPAWQAYLARIHAMNGEAADSVAILRRDLIVTGGLGSRATLQLDPVWDPIRKDPGFAQLVAITR